MSCFRLAPVSSIVKRSSLVLHKRYVSIYDQLTIEYTNTSNDTLQRIDKITQYHFTNVYREVNTLCVVSSSIHDNIFFYYAH